jgi:periplasmic copper chaperone A
MLRRRNNDAAWEAEDTHVMRTPPSAGPLARPADPPWPATGRPGGTRPGRTLPGARRPGVLRGAVAACALAVLAAGCTMRAAASPSMAITTASVPQPTTPGMTSAYLDIRNNGAVADRLVAARASVGGHVALRVPDGHGMTMKTVQQIAIPSHATVRMAPDEMHLLITGASGRMTGGKDITLTLTFAHAGTMSVPAMVTDPESGGSSYFTN